MICPVCKKENNKSMVTRNGSTSTLMGYSTYWDEKGIIHHHDRNRVTTEYNCSNRHTFLGVRKGNPCPSYPQNCDFDGGEEEIKIIEKD